MAHQIENNMMAYKGAVPWHGLGFAVAPNATGEEMMVTAGLDWLVQKRALAMRNGNGDKTVMLTYPLSSYRAIVRADTDTVFQIASNRYQPVQNSEIIGFFREYCEAGHAEMETVGGLKNGAVVWALAKLNGGSSTTIGASGQDALKGYMLLATSHDGSLRTIGKPTQVRVVCHNTLTAALSGAVGTFSLKHSTKFGPRQKDEARRIMGMASGQIAATNELAATLSKVKVDQKGRVEFITRLLNGETLLEQVVNTTQPGARTGSILDDVIAGHEVATATAPDADSLDKVGKAILEAMIASPGSQLDSAKDTLWGAVNGVTWYADHAARTRTDSNRMFSAWFGAGDQLKTKAMRQAVELAGVSVGRAGRAVAVMGGCLR